MQALNGLGVIYILIFLAACDIIKKISVEKENGYEIFG